MAQRIKPAPEHRAVSDFAHRSSIQVFIQDWKLDRENTACAKVLSNTIKKKRKEKAGKWDVSLPKVRPVAEDEMFRVIKTGKRKTKQWKRMVTKATFVGPSFTRKPPKYERLIRPSGLRFTKYARVTNNHDSDGCINAQVTNNLENDGCINAVLLV